MTTSRPFAYNTGTGITGTTQIGSLAVGYPAEGFNSTGLEWWSGPDEDLGYVIAQSVPSDTQPTPVPGVFASVSFFRSDALSDSSFISLANMIAGPSGPFTSATGANYWLTDNGYWNSYQVLSPLLSLDAASYSGSGPWIDSVGGKSFTLANSPAWSSNNGGYFNFTPAASQYAICNTSLPSLNTWTVGVWHFYDGSITGSAPCIVTETFIGGGINYSLGRNDGGFSAGFFDGGWRVTDGYTLTPGNWYYIVGTYDGATVKLYVNNTLVDSTAYAGTPTTSGAGIRLMERWDLSDYWGGRLAKVDIYDEPLDSNQIDSIWNSTKSRFGL